MKPDFFAVERLLRICEAHFQLQEQGRIGFHAIALSKVHKDLQSIQEGEMIGPLQEDSCVAVKSVSGRSAEYAKLLPH